jgi:hypothetical protein
MSLGWRLMKRFQKVSHLSVMNRAIALSKTGDKVACHGRGSGADKRHSTLHPPRWSA